MKYGELLQIANFFKGFKKVDFIKRIDDNILEISLDSKHFIIDLNRANSSIYTGALKSKNYNAPFDIMLKKYSNHAFLKEVFIKPNDRILVFKLSLQTSYKSFESLIYLEFTGKNTNAIITDEKGIILEALRHIQKSYRLIKVGEKLIDLKSYELREQKSEKIEDFYQYFENNFKKIYEKRLENSKQNKITSLDKKISNLNHLLTSLEKEENLEKKAAEISQKALILSSNLYHLKDYEREFTLQDFNNQEIQYKLLKAPKIEANELFKNAKKLKQKALNIHLQRINLEEKLEFLQHLKTLIQNTSSIFELEVLMPKKEKKEHKIEQNLGVASFYFKEFKILVGKNEKANEYLLKNAKKDDLWLHIKDFASPHVFIVANKLKINDELIEFGAKLCVNFANLQKGNYTIDYTQRKFVKIKQNAFVTYTNHKSLKLSKE